MLTPYESQFNEKEVWIRVLNMISHGNVRNNNVSLCRIFKKSSRIQYVVFTIDLLVL